METIEIKLTANTSAKVTRADGTWVLVAPLVPLPAAPTNIVNLPPRRPAPTPAPKPEPEVRVTAPSLQFPSIDPGSVADQARVSVAYSYCPRWPGNRDVLQGVATAFTNVYFHGAHDEATLMLAMASFGTPDTLKDALLGLVRSFPDKSGVILGIAVGITEYLNTTKK